MRVWREAHVQVKMHEHIILGPRLEIWMSKPKLQLHHRRPQTVGGVKKILEKQDETH